MQFISIQSSCNQMVTWGSESFYKKAMLCFMFICLFNMGVKAQNVFPAIGYVELLNPTSSASESKLTGIYLKTRGADNVEGSKTWGMFTAAIGGGFGVVPNAFEIWEYPETAPRFQLLPGGNVLMGNLGGNVGIGTSSPVAKLDVVGDGKFSGGLNIAGDVYMHGDRNVIQNQLQFVSTTGYGHHILRQMPETTQGSQFEIARYTGGAYDFAAMVTFKPDGKVLIGESTLTAPGSYKLYVQDGILTEKVKIALKNSAQWADFVFEPDYQLMPLSQVEAFIKTNKHLPGIASEKEMLENGLDVAEMQKLHMQKIEELTLYTIEQDKKAAEQDKKIKTLEERLAAIEKLLLEKDSE